MLVVAVVFPVLAFIFLGGVVFYTRKQNKPKNKRAASVEVDENNEDGVKVNNSELKKLTKIKKIKGSKIYLKNGAIRVNLGISSPDFELLTDEEQTSFEDCLMMSALSLNFPVQFHTTLKKIEIKEPAELVEKTMNSSDSLISDNLRDYCSQLYSSYKKLEHEKGIFVRKSFCTVGAYLPDRDEKKVLNELQSRIDNIAGGLSRARMKINLLNSESTAQILADLFNRGKNIKIETLEKDGAFDLYSEGVGQVVEVQEG
ncbi:cbb3-type cytochrome oxidase subunit 3 [Clostridium acetobutylicum]|uniref:Uncharacterized secreted protein n=1 Tax=Clostridium acetobutylicum (strain ATCC 824 / DSM 792 / JCM 1419 / IAM 19013 / LMG 5710 / NBRC 13948 / NRRL B-527 / VKM B-1787 / 2291 / W) TaxID=272562 RepID=Q97HG3_CLOAB|nr:MULTISPECIES: hypothetical protein [Clostridium]AAK80007.1 Uncharacterized secreted protein [Clostridium acetobutylicum ATCC 824]ADZ21099.1 Conserved hypothetical protein [Clostridium acetobutylicum EA 2018]AEI32154.1 hypothetical protein SMB_G2080 [Clostridium acetobutylicum DSM 1731]AWV79564.1 hypothetical protein DK921_05505 [Clostridium acetobutylicum]MBC2394462.1 hypothetical protein [Clostridium acetobutylicum]